MLPPTVATMLLHQILQEHIFCTACDNSGDVFRLNCGSCRNPVGRKLIQTMSDALAKVKGHSLADWNNREQSRAKHADDLSKTLTEEEWHQIQHEDLPAWMFNLYIHHIKSNTCVAADIRIPRIAEVLPRHLRHANTQPSHFSSPIQTILSSTTSTA